MITGVLAGLAKTCKNLTIAHEALMLAIARNPKLHLNWAVRYDTVYDPESGAAGYKSAFLHPDYLVRCPEVYLQIKSTRLVHLTHHT